MADYDTTAALAYFKLKWLNPKCPLCQGDQWSIEPKTFQITEFHQGNMVIGGPVIPVIPVTCKNCGNTVLLNAIAAGAVKKG